MYNIEFYETVEGFSDIRDFLDSLRAKADSVKDARIQFGQAARYIQLLQNNGTNLPVEIAKHIEDAQLDYTELTTCGHFIHMEQPEMFNEKLKAFIKE